MPVSGSTLVAAQRPIRFVTFSRAAPIARSCSEQAEFMPGRPARRHRGWRGSAADGPARRPRSRSPPRGEIDDRDHLGGHIREAVAVGLEHLGRAAQFGRHEAAEERLDREPALPGRQIAARSLAAVAADGQGVARVVIARVERAPAARCASASGTASSGDSAGPRDRSRRGRSRSRICGRPEASAPGSRRTPSSCSGLRPFTG